MSSRPVTTPLPPLLQQMMVRWTLGRCISLLIMWMHCLSFCQQMPNDLLALPFLFQMERKTGLFYQDYLVFTSPQLVLGEYKGWCDLKRPEVLAFKWLNVTLYEASLNF